jgi:hypothetical protein
LKLVADILNSDKMYLTKRKIKQCDKNRVKSRRIRWAGHVARVREERKVYKVLMGKPEGKRPLGRPRRRWEDGISMDLREIGLRVWIGLDWLRTGTGGRAVVGAVMNLRVLASRS